MVAGLFIARLQRLSAACGRYCSLSVHRANSRTGAMTFIDACRGYRRRIDDAFALVEFIGAELSSKPAQRKRSSDGAGFGFFDEVRKAFFALKLVARRDQSASLIFDHSTHESVDFSYGDDFCFDRPLRPLFAKPNEALRTAL